MLLWDLHNAHLYMHLDVQCMYHFVNVIATNISRVHVHELF